MKFKKVFRGYDPQEVDKHVNETAAKDQQIRREQKERIDELLEENRALRSAVQQFQADEKAIVKTLIASQNLAQEVRLDADSYSEMVLVRAKIFCASWRAYSQVLISSLSDDEVREFNLLQRKIESLISDYEHGADVSQAAATQAAASNAQPKSSGDKFGTFSNPISRIEGSSEQKIDLNELLNPTQSLEEICAELGITPRRGGN